LSGLLLLLLGLWGGLIAFVGPYVDFAYTPDKAWVFTDDRLWLEIAPAAATGLGGLIVLLSANRIIAMFGAWLAALGGAWFVVGPTVSALWTARGVSATGTPIGDETKQVAEQLAFFYGVGVLTVFVAALALGRLAVVAVRDARLAEEETAEAPRPATATGPEPTPPIGATQPLPRRYSRNAQRDTTPAPPHAGPEYGDQMVAPNPSGARPRGL
jgi:hypothetical protein